MVKRPSPTDMASRPPWKFSCLVRWRPLAPDGNTSSHSSEQQMDEEAVWAASRFSDVQTLESLIKMTASEAQGHSTQHGSSFPLPLSPSFTL